MTTIFWNVTSCSLEDSDRNFAGTYISTILYRVSSLKTIDVRVSHVINYQVFKNKC
jgi:hypothetical protein